MNALMLAAGLGRRLYGDENTELPKCLLTFAGETLLKRHIDALVACGVTSLTLIVGHRQDDVCAEAFKFAPRDFVTPIFNPRYREGPKLSLAVGAQTLRCGDDVLFMDADVLYHPQLLERLVHSNTANCLLMDRNFQSTDDFVKVCLLGGRVVDFGKVVGDSCRKPDHDTVGEWPGFCKLSPDIASAIADSIEGFVTRDEVEGAYEEAFREVLLNSPPDTFGVEDISGIPWVEIDFQSDLDKANHEVFPRIVKSLAGRGTNG